MNSSRSLKFRTFVHLIFVIYLLNSHLVVGAARIPQPASTFAPSLSPHPTGSAPLRFEPNVGQADPSVQYLTRGPGYTAFFTGTEIVWGLRKSVVEAESIQPDSILFPSAGIPHSQELALTPLRMKLVKSQPEPVVEPHQLLPGKSNYLIGALPENWHRDIPTFGQLQIRDVYPGIDMVVYSQGHQLEYDFVLAPGARPEQIQLEFGNTSAPVSLDLEGNLILSAGGINLIQKRPTLYQEINGERVQIEGAFSLLAGNQVGFQVPAFDPAYPLVIDPVVSVQASTYIGGSGNDNFTGVAIDSSRNLYLCGNTTSTNFPLDSPFQAESKGAIDAVILKFNPTGELVYSTYLGGGANDLAGDITVDSEGNAYVTGSTASTDFPVVTPIQRFPGGGDDAFIAKLNPQGNELVFATYLGGPANGVVTTEQGNAIAIDTTGAIYVTGVTASPGFPTVNPFQSRLGGSSNFTDAFVTKLNPSGSQILFSTYLGGRANSQEFGLGIAPDSAGNVYVYGLTLNFRVSALQIDFPVTSTAFQREFGGGGSDMFITKFNATGDQLLFSSYLGGLDDENATCTTGTCSNVLSKKQIAVDADGNVVIAGFTRSENYPVRNPVQARYGGNVDAVVTQISSDGTAILFSTFLGGSQSDFGTAVAVGPTGNIYVTGPTFSPNFPTMNPTQPASGGSSDTYVAQLSPTDGKLVFSTYLGGTGNDQSNEINVGPNGAFHVVGFTSSTDFPVQNAFQSRSNGSQEAFLTSYGEVEAVPDFSLTIEPATQSLTTGETKSVEVKLQGINGFNQQVNLQTQVTPATTEVKPVLSVTSALPNAPVTLTINATTSAQPGEYTVTVAGTAQTLERQAVVKVMVTQTADTQKPVVIVSTPADGAQFESRPNAEIQVSWQSSDDRGVVAHSVELKGQRNGTPFQETVVTGLPGTASSLIVKLTENDAFTQGQITVSATDAAGNLGMGQSGVFTVTAPPPPDTQSPTVSQISLSKTSIKRKKDPSLTISWTSSDNVAVTNHDLTYATDGVTFETTVVSGLAGTVQTFTWTVPASLAKTKQGRVKVIAKDEAGNQGDALSESLKIK